MQQLLNSGRLNIVTRDGGRPTISSELNDIELMEMIGSELEDEIFIEIITSEDAIWKNEIVHYSINALLERIDENNG